MNVGWNIETYITVTTIILSTIICIQIIRVNWKQYGLLYALGAMVGEVLCYFFVKVGFYSFPYRLFPHIFPLPFTLVLTLFPFYILFGVRYSPKAWPFKIPFYWVLVHIGMTCEVLAQKFTLIIKYQRFWDTWDSYTWWWIFLLVFEVIGGIVVSPEYRRPIDEVCLRYGRIGWFIIHAVFIGTIFLAGFYMGRITVK